MRILLLGMNHGSAPLELRERLAATLEGQNNNLKIVNHTGHKLITGYPEGRRMWVSAAWFDSNGTLLREDGAYGPMDVTINGSTVTVNILYELHPATGRGKIYEAHYGMTSGWASQLSSLGYPDSFILGFDCTSKLARGQIRNKTFIFIYPK